jgi:hypothetical protein
MSCGNRPQWGLSTSILLSMVGLALCVLAGCSSDTAPIDGRPSTVNPLTTADPSALGDPVASGDGPQVGSTVFIDAAAGGEVVSGRIRIVFEPDALPRSMPVALTVLEPTSPQFRVDPEGTALAKEMRLSVSLLGGSPASMFRARFLARTSSGAWRALPTFRSQTEIYAYAGAFGEFLLTAPEIKGRRPGTPGIGGSKR